MYLEFFSLTQSVYIMFSPEADTSREKRDSFQNEGHKSGQILSGTRMKRPKEHQVLSFYYYIHLDNLGKHKRNNFLRVQNITTFIIYVKVDID